MTGKIKARIQHLRFIGITEGISYILLLVVAMPLKYIFDYPMAVKVTGWIHGGLFVWYVLAVFLAAFAARWSFKKIMLFLVASLIPLATFVLDKRLKEEADSLSQPV